MNILKIILILGFLIWKTSRKWEIWKSVFSKIKKIKIYCCFKNFIDFINKKIKIRKIY